jgi:hypothetical protein
MTHYALSEILIVLGAAWAARRLYAHHRYGAALACGVFGLAAALGAIRFGLDRDGSLIAALADIHRFAGTWGGSFAMTALVYDMAQRRLSAPQWQKYQRPYMALAALALAGALAFPPLAVAVFLLWSVGFIVLVVASADILQQGKLAAFSIAALMLVNVVLFRQAAWLSPAMSWHIFHVLVAVWLFGLGHMLGRARAA